ncbi:MAG: Chemotaxis response regulator protein-glutamate methylesterase [Anaerolineae bacterium]|nr:Chemotaxis response regulator protein-glutamate methylesterase [Anaerolineae bacterium]
MPGLLVVDDTAIIRSTIAKIVTREHLNITPIIEADNGEEAVRLAQEHRPDIVFMDIKMPGMNGLQATSLIRQDNPAAKIVMLTAYDEFSYVQEALKLGAVDYLLKPVRPNKIVEVISQIQTLINEERTQQQIFHETRQQLKKALPIIEASLVDDLIFRQAPEPTLLKKNLRQLGKSIAAPVVMVIAIDDYNKIVKRLKPEILLQHSDEIIEVINRALEQPAKALVGYWQLGQLAVILSTDQQWETVTSQKALAEVIRQNVAGQVHFTVTAGFGRRYDSLENIAISYAEARLAQHHAPIGGNCVIHIADINPDSPRRSYVYPLTLERELLENVRLKQEDICLELMNEIVDNLLYNYRQDPQILYSYLAELLTLISRTMIEIGAPAADVFHLSNHQMAVLFSAPSPAQLRAWALNSLTELLATVEFEATHPNPDAIQMAIEHIHKNHQNPDISLNDVAKTVGLSQSHLAYLLKERTGQSYTSYLSALRIKHAKKLLRTTSMTIAAIAESVGYPNATHFYRIFRRETGHTPKAYRDAKSHQA